MATCPIKSSDAWKLLVSSRGEDIAHYLWDKYDGNVPESESKSEIVKSGLKSINTLNTQKAKDVFSKGQKNKWPLEKTLTELQIPREQKQLIINSYNNLLFTNNEITIEPTLNEIVTDLLANYSYAVEINTATENGYANVSGDKTLNFTLNGDTYTSFTYVQQYEDDSPTHTVYYKNQIDITKEEFDKAFKFSGEKQENTQYYSNLTVPGGTNYTENAIQTPNILNISTAHTEDFSKGVSNMLGWFRSDEKDETGEYILEDYTQNDLDNAMSTQNEELYQIINKGGKKKVYKSAQTKTRRVLEVQSNLFQKFRDRKDLAGMSTNIINTANIFQNEEYSFELNDMAYEAVVEDIYYPDENQTEPSTVYYKNGMRISSKEMEIAKKEYKKQNIPDSKNQFLQLLNKDNNWVTFFVKSIIQDSAKKGYEKVLFPSGNTASKVEGHTTLEEFKKQQQDRLEGLTDRKNNLKIIEREDKTYKWGLDSDGMVTRYLTKEDAQSEMDSQKQSLDKEINNLKQELKRVEGPEGFGALKPIYNFYENTVTNILNKQYGKENVKQVTDEYGNTWNEVEIVPEREQQAIFLQKPGVSAQKASPKLIGLMKEFIKSIGVDYKLVSDIVVDGKKVDANGVALIMQKLIQVAEGKEDEALPEEAMHFAVEIIKQTNPKLYQTLLKEINGHPTLNEVVQLYGNDPQYQKDGRRDFLKLKEEAIAQVLANRLEDILGKSLWDKIVDFLKGLFFAKSGFDQASMDVLSGKIASVEDIDVSQGGVYFQLTPGEKVFNDLLTTSNQIKVVENGVDENGKPKTTYALGDLKAVRRVSDFANDFYESVFPDIGKTDFEKALNDLKAEKGTAGHLDLEHAQKVLVDPLTGLLREEELDDSEYTSKLNPRDNAMYTLLKNNLRDRLNSFPVGTRFMSEVKIFDKKRKIAGTVDFLAITPEGKVNILDWKFMDLNTEYYEDVPWYKVKAWNIQMGKYKDIISTNYNVKNENFQQTRMIPILAKYSLADYELELLPRLLEIQIGDVNVKNIEEDYLLPIGITEEKTGEKRIDLLINKLNGVYKKLSEERVQESEKSAKAEQLNALYKAIRHLHIKENVTPLINQAKILNKQVSMLIKRHDAEFKDKNPSEVDQEKINAFAGMIRIHLEALQPYLDLDQLRFLLKEDTEENNKLKATIVSTVQNVKDYIYELQELDKTFGEKFNNTSSTPEKVVKGITKWFSSVSTLQVQNIQSLYKLANKAFFLSSEETLQEVKELNTLKEAYDKWARSKRLSLNNYFDILTKKDKNELIDQFDKDFYTQLKSKIKNKNFKWILENIDQEAYKEYVDKKIEEEKDRIFSRPQVGTEEEITASIKKELAKVYSRYDLSGQNTSGWLLYREIKEFPKKETWESKEWKELNKPENAPAKAFYNYIIKRNKYYQDINYLNGKAARKFLPWMRQGFVEGLVFEGKSRGLGEEFLRNISMDEGEAGYGQTDPVTGELINTIPKYFTKDLGEGYSKDLFKTMALYNEYAIKFKNLSDIEERALQLLRAERNKKSIMSSTFGKIIPKDGESKFNETNLENSKLLEDMIKGIIYQQKFVQSEVFDIALGKISGFGKNINEKLGMKIFPENLEDRQLSFNKAINTLNTAFQMNVLGLNTLSSISNYFGGTANGLINAGTYFTKYDFIKTQMWFLTNKMKGTVLGKESLGNTPNKALAALDYFLPFVDNYNKDAARKLSLNKLDEQAVQDFLMIMMRKGEEAIQTVNFFAFLKNAVVIDNKIINVREYLKTTNEYKAFYSGTQAERKARHEKFEKDVETLLDEKGVLQLGQIVNGEFTIPGVDKKSDSVMEFRRLVQSFTTDALGSMTEENRRLANMNVYSASAMVFKNWIPRLVDVRIGDMKYNAASDAYEWGRMRMIFGNLVAKDLLKSIKSLKAAIGGDGDVWLNQVRSLYERKQQEYFNNTGKTLNMTEDQFIALVNQNIKNQIVDVIILGSLLSLLAILKAFTPDDDEDPIVKNQYKFLLKATDKLTDELMYFYNPTSPIELISGKGGIFPAIGLLNNYSNFLTNFLKENYGIITENEEIQDDAKPIKYLMKSFPISSQAAGLLPMFYPEVAKDLGIKMQGQYGIR